jgi:trimeric autotransporter adhesin
LTVFRGNLYGTDSSFFGSGNFIDNLLRWTGTTWVGVESWSSGDTLRLKVDGDSLYWVRRGYTVSSSAIGTSVCRYNGSTVTFLGRSKGNFTSVCEIAGGVYLSGNLHSVSTLPNNEFGPYLGNIVKLQGGVASSITPGLPHRSIRSLALAGADLLTTHAYPLSGELTPLLLSRATPGSWTTYTTGECIESTTALGSLGSLSVLSADYEAHHYSQQGNTWTWLNSPYMKISGYQAWNGSMYAASQMIIGGTGGVHRLSGTTWSETLGAFNLRVASLATLDGQLIAGGAFTSVGAVAAAHAASWNGAAWSPLGAGTQSSIGRLTPHLSGVVALECSSFREFDVIPVRLSYWNGTWTVLTPVQLTGTGANVRAIASYGGEVYIAGSFAAVNGVPASNIARWTGTRWKAVGSGTNGLINGLVVRNDELIVGGEFSRAGDVRCGYLAAWSVAPGACRGDFNCDGGIDGSDVEAFFDAWEAGDAAGDVNGDGGVDNGDVEAFFAAWEGGC